MAALALLLFDPQPAHAAEPGIPVPPSGLLTNTGEGAVTAADKDFVSKVRLAGLWEIPAGEIAQKKSSDPQIREIGAEIAKQHRGLDELTRNAAKKLGIKVPNKPNADQQKWLNEMRNAKGDEFDLVYIDRLRAAHGTIFPAIATIRASTQNDTVRRLAQQANQFVMTHMTLLESSGIVDFKALPGAPAPSASASAPPSASAADRLRPAANATGTEGASTALLILTLAAGLMVGVLATRHLMLRPSGGRRPYRRRF